MVHVLDYLYFHEEDPNLYSSVIWLTWATVPEVEARIDHYILRTMLAVGVLIRGTSEDRFNSAMEKVASSLRTLSASPAVPDTHIIEKAIEILGDRKRCTCLKYQFKACCPLIDMVRYTLYATQICSGLTEGAREMANLAFEDRDISSPYSFVFDQIKKRFDKEPEDRLEEALKQTCWEQLVLSSPP